MKRRQEVVGAAFPALAEAYRAEEERGRQVRAAGFEPRYPGHDVQGRGFYLFRLATTEDFLWRDEPVEEWRPFVVERASAFGLTFPEPLAPPAAAARAPAGGRGSG